MYVIDLILNEEAAAELPEDILYQLADITSDAVMLNIKKYLKNPNANPKVKDKIFMIYENKLNTAEFLGSVDVLDAVTNVKDLKYEDINVLTDINKLRKWGEDIEFILQSKYATPYIAPISAQIVRNYCDVIDSYVNTNEDVSKSVQDFAAAMHHYTFLFKDKPSARAKGTIVKKVVRNKSQYEVMLRGIKFLISKMEAGVSPESWRIL